MQCTNLGGMEQAMYEMMRALQGRGYDFRVVALHPLGLGEKILAEIGVPAVGCPYRGKFGLLSHHLYRAQVTRQAPDLVLVTGASVGNCWAARAFPKIPKVLTIHYYHGNSPRNRLRWRGFYTLFSSFFDRVIFNSDFLRKEATGIFPPLAAKSLTIPLPLAVPPYPQEGERREARRALGLEEDSRVIGNAGWLIPTKRFDVLLKVAANLLPKYPDLWVVIAGSGEEEGALRAQAVELGLAHRVRWLGWQEDLRQFYLALDLLIFNSDGESVGRTPLEAMSYGIPVVASICYGGGLGETLRHGESGFLLSQHEVPALTAFGEQLLADREFAARLGLAGREAVAARHHNEHTIPAYRAVFDELAGSKDAWQK
jgi:glycosyltransferase involved in cell wall biosynthesis